jgi:hypothetical protein
VGDKFAILSNITAGAISGQFQGLSEGATFNSGSDQFMITYLGNAGDGTNGNDIVLTLEAVPEPSTWVAGGLAFATLLCMQRRRLCLAKACAAVAFSSTGLRLLWTGARSSAASDL